MTKKNNTQWRSLNSLLASSDVHEAAKHEFPEGASDSPTNVDRRQFLGILGATTALAGVGLQGCMRKRERHIRPFTNRPEDYLPGEARYYASNLFVGDEVLPVLVRSNDGRPSKIEGNPRSTEILGRSTVFAQAEILRLFDTDRARTAFSGDKELTESDVTKSLDILRGQLTDSKGQGTAVVVPPIPSPTLKAQLDAFQQTYPQAQLFVVDTKTAGHQQAALQALGVDNGRITYDLAAAKIVLTLDADILHTEGDVLRNSVGFSSNRTISTPRDELNRLYSVEPMFSVTGSNADHSLRLPASQIGAVTRAIAAGVGVGGVSAGELSADAQKFVTALVKDLKANAGNSAVAVGERQPAYVHQLGVAINQALGNLGKTVNIVQNDALPVGGSFSDLNKALAAGSITTILTLGVNTVYGAPTAWGFADNFKKAETRVTLAFHRDETALASTLHIPETHALECWGDLQANSGRLGIQQPLIEPLFPALSAIQVLNRLLTEDQNDDYNIVQDAWVKTIGGVGFGKAWDRWLHDGIGPVRELQAATPNLGGVGQAASAAETPAAPSGKQVELTLQNSSTVLDGRYGNVSWMQEFPHPISKLTWDNAALMNPTTADALGIKWGSANTSGKEKATILEITAGGRKIKVPAFIIPGIADNVVVVEFGYGRDLGPVSKDAGVDVRGIQDEDGSWIIPNAAVATTSERYMLASTQDHWSMNPMPGNERYHRPLVRETDIETYRQRPDFVRDDDEVAPSEARSLWTEPNPSQGQQWGMSIDLNACTGCGACTIACQAENNIVVVGKSQVLNGREMHWIRIDRYFTGEETDPGLVNQPVGCQHCATAPCEAVCPVAATIHSSEGLNDMVYNRCIGTRYCANNCPYKVRRFNFLAYSRYETESNEMMALQRNPRVTIRHRGVMEKCSYCVQRINHERVRARVHGDGIIADGAIQVACEQACPTGAIIFGDINDPTSRVSIAKRQDRNYELLGWLNTQPRTTYLARVRNPNPELA